MSIARCDLDESTVLVKQAQEAFPDLEGIITPFLYYVDGFHKHEGWLAWHKNRVIELENDLASRDAKLKEYDQVLNETYASRAYRLGSALGRPWRVAKRLLKGRR